MSNPNFRDFVRSCENDYRNKYFPKLCDESDKAQREIEIKTARESSLVTLAQVLGSKFGSSVRFSSDISLMYLESYHNWLLENFNIIPKE